MMEHSGLGGIITNWFVHIATKETFPIMAFFSAALTNFAVPSGGGALGNTRTFCYASGSEMIFVVGLQFL
jgi:short subunit fatty acids transporter